MPLNHDQLMIEISAFEQLLSRHSILDLARQIAIIWVLPDSVNVWISHYGAMSPYKQTAYILALALNAPEPLLPEPLTDVALQNICRMSSDIFGHYIGNVSRQKL